MMHIPVEPRVGDGFRALTELAPDVVVLLDRSGAVKYASPALEKILGHLPVEVTGRLFLEYVHPDDRKTGWDAFLSVLQSHEIVGATLRCRHKDDSWRVIDAVARNFSDVPDIAAILVFTRDVTRHVETERALREARDEAEDLYNHAPCGYHSVDANGRFVRINDTELQWLGYTRDEVVGQKSILDVLTPDSRALFERQFPIFVKQGRISELEFELTRKDGSILPILLSATAVVDAQGRYVMSRSVAYDITERKRAEYALRKVNRALRVLSAVDRELIHAENEAELFEAVCQVIVNLGGYRMAWVGFARQDGARTVEPVAQAGIEAGYVARLNITWSATERGRGPTGTAIRTGVPQVNQNFLTNSLTAPWRAEALKCGYQSSIALPLRDRSGVFGALTIYAAEPDAFNLEEFDLLVELAGNLAFRVVTLRGRAEHLRAEAMIKRLAYFDPLTGLPNRAQLMDLLAQEIGRMRPDGPGPALLTLDVSGFNDILTGLGVSQADQVLKQIAGRLQGALDRDEQLARIGGDVFAVLLGPGDAERAQTCARRIEAALIKPFQQAGIPLTVRMNIGAAIAPEHGAQPDTLMLRSNIAARQAKKTGVGFALYAGTTNTESPRYLALITELRTAIEEQQLVLHYQPKVDIGTGRIAGAEALVRWPHPERGLIPPNEFIEIAEHTGLIKPLTYHVLDLALHQCFLWRDRGFELPVAVNVSQRNFKDPEFLSRVLELLQTWKVRPELLQLEITETALMEEPARTHDLLVDLSNRGVVVSVDDFGTGYSSLSYVATLPIRALKIDRSFVFKMLASSRIHSVVGATVSLARVLGLKTVAEGVDAKEVAEEVIRLGCDEIQGYYFSRPVAAGELERWTRGFRLASYGFAGNPS